MARSALLRIVMLGLVPVVAGIGLSEIYIRNFHKDGYYTPETLRNSRQLNYQPAVYARHILPAREQTVAGWQGNSYRINGKGYRGPDFATAKPPGTVRIIIYGGSAVFDLGASDGRDWPRQVETLLRRSGFPDVEIINAGIPGHASADAVGRLLYEGHYFAPDYVVLYNGWNDLKQFHDSEPTLRQLRPWKQGLDPRLFYRNDFDRFLSETSQFYVRARQTFWTWRLKAGAEGAAGSRSDTAMLEPVVEPATKNRYGFYDQGVRQFRLNVATFVDVARNLGAVPILMTQARLGRPDNTEEEKKKIAYDYIKLDHRAYLEAYARMDRSLVEVAREKQATLIDAAGLVPRDLDHFRDHVHLRTRGTDLLAKITADSLRVILARRADRNGIDTMSGVAPAR